MRITSQIPYQTPASSTPRLDTAAQKSIAQWHNADSSGAITYDQVEISEKGRQLAADAIQSHPAKYYGTAEINEALTQVLEGKPAEVADAVYGIIESNFIVDGNVNDDEKRKALLEMGISQSKYIAENYMEGEQADKFLKTMNTIAAVASTRSTDPVTGDISYKLPSSRPAGAPEDYINPSELMKQADPETYSRFMNDISLGGNGLDILLDFVKKVPKHPEWADQFKEQTAQNDQLLNNTHIQNRFDTADTSSPAAFLESMQSILADSSLKDDAYLQNMHGFYKTLGIIKS
ncbi:hypothetical protein [Paenibacillus jilunlii]|uniref:Uncharacterized protein n=2 Tax=Paenibacillus jilunlii TaxID=682956 RepID=A0A1G9VMR3_9BACL|nr:hypothetical protein [Paenibacillus jilunlii]KWX75849.1 hypothetical protein AML91_11745 [Paenibacillus jilunlii]SDM73396.1 hypothetical protein SAMN05216191_11772 [Paenibacillus jilunlii]